MKKVLLFFYLVIHTFLAVGQGCPGPSQRTALINLQRSNVIEGGRAGQLPLTDTCGNLRYAQYVEINLIPIAYTPTATGNTENLSEFVETPSGAVWYIDWQGQARRLTLEPDRDWLKISNNSIPYAITDSIYTDNYAAVNMRVVWPKAQFLYGDSTSLDGGNAVGAGLRDVRIGFKRLLDSAAYSSLGQEGRTLTARIGPQTNSFRIQKAGGVQPTAPTAPFRDIFAVQDDSLILLKDYPYTRVDTSTPYNFCYTNEQGYLQTRLLTDLPFGTGTVESVNITPPAAGITASGGPITSSGSITLGLANDLAAYEGLTTNGIVVRTGDGTATTRAMSFSGDVSNAPGWLGAFDNSDGVAGSPALRLFSGGFGWHQTCKVVATTNISLSGTQTIDGIAANVGDRVLVTAQTTGTNNGIYVVSAGAWARAGDSDASGEFNGGQMMWVSQGSVYGNSFWYMATPPPITMGSTSISYSRFNGVGDNWGSDFVNTTGGFFTGNGKVATPLSLASGSITATQLANTGVSAGSYTNANITINAQGLITAASNGSGGGAPAGTSTQTLRYDGTNTLVSTSQITNNGSEVGIGGAPVAGFELYTNGATRTDGTGVFRGSGSAFAGGLTGASVRLTNTVASSSAYMGVDDSGVFHLQQNVGNDILTTDPTVGAVAVTNSFDLQGTISPASIGSDQNDYDLGDGGAAAIARLTSSAAVNTTGLTGGRPGRVLAINNIGSFNITLKNEDAASTAANRFALGGDIILSAGNGVILIYDATSSRWRYYGAPAQSSLTYEFSSPVTGSSVTIPSRAVAVHVLCIAAGAGGGSGRKGAAGTVRCGGGGGASGPIAENTTLISLLGGATTLSVTVGAGGAGGAARTTDNTNGLSGSGGGATVVTVSGNTICRASGGTGGGGGSATSGSAGGSGNSDFSSSAGGAASGTGGAGSQANSSSNRCSAGGGPGGGITTGDVASNGGNGGAGQYGVIQSGNGGTTVSPDATAPATSPQYGCQGGGGGASSITGNGGNGSNGVRGSGGGGGGAAVNGVGDSGAGGNGGDGYVRIIFTF